MRQGLKGCRKILDVGCGTGRDLAELFKAGHDVFGADACAEMLKEAGEACRAAGLDPAGRLFEQSLPDLGVFKDGEFDGVLCSAVLMHLPEGAMFEYNRVRFTRDARVLVPLAAIAARTTRKRKMGAEADG